MILRLILMAIGIAGIIIFFLPLGKKGIANAGGRELLLQLFKCNFNFYPQFNYFEENDIIPQYAGTTRTVNRSRKSVFGGNTFSNNDDFQLPF